jgi:DNA-binding NarL/FixJ family response regulator
MQTLTCKPSVPADKATSVSEVPGMPTKPYRILLVDDHPVVLRGLRNLLETQPGIEVCFQVSTGAEAIEYVKNEKPDLVMLDLTMPDMSGLDVAHAIRQQSPSTGVLVVTMHFSEELAREVLRTGALGYVLKSDADSELLAAVDHAQHGQLFFTNELSISMAQDFARDIGDGGEKRRRLGYPLSAREVEVVRLLAQGDSNKEAAWKLDVSVRTVESHRGHIMKKMGFGSFSDLVRFALRSGIIKT